MIKFATRPEHPFRASDAASAPREKNEPATPFKSPCKYFAGAFAGSGYVRRRLDEAKTVPNLTSF